MGYCLRVGHPDLQMELAIKQVLPALLAEADISVRFISELNSWLTASSCSLIAEVSAIVALDSMPAAVSPWMQGGDLRARMKCLTVKEKLKVILRTVRGLSWAHKELALIHRDIKPENILLDQRGLSYISDWGLAKPLNILSSNNEISVGLGPTLATGTSVGQFVGTISYAAPEQILGSRDVDFRADIYSVACLMYELETGSPPFVGKTFADIKQQHLTKKPRRLGGLFNDGALGLASIISSCLAKEPDHRSSYEEIAFVIEKKCHRAGVETDECQLTFRHQRKFLLDSPMDNGKNLGAKECNLVDGQLARIYEQALQLIAVGKDMAALNLVRPYCEYYKRFPEQDWNVTHSIAAVYSLCCILNSQNMSDSWNTLWELKKSTKPPRAFWPLLSLAVRAAEGEVGMASGVCSEGLEDYPDDLALLNEQTYNTVAHGYFDEALLFLKRRLSLRRDGLTLTNATFLYQQMADDTLDTDVELALGRLEQAAICNEEGLLLLPTHGLLWLLKARLHNMSGQLDQAVEILRYIVSNQTAHRELRRDALFSLVGIIRSYARTDKLVALLNELSVELQKLDNNYSITTISDCKLEIFAEYSFLESMRTGRPFKVHPRGEKFAAAHPYSELKYLVASGEYSRALNLSETLRDGWRDESSCCDRLRSNLVCHVTMRQEHLTVDCIAQALEKYPWNDKMLGTLKWGASQQSDDGLQDIIATRMLEKSAMMERFRGLIAARNWPVRPKQLHGMGWCDNKSSYLPDADE